MLARMLSVERYHGVTHLRKNAWFRDERLADMTNARVPARRHLRDVSIKVQPRITHGEKTGGGVCFQSTLLVYSNYI